MTKVKIEFSMFGSGDVVIKAKDAKDAVRKFDEMSVKELAGWCNFTSFDESGIRIIAIDDEPIEADLWEVKKDLGLE